MTGITLNMCNANELACYKNIIEFFKEGLLNCESLIIKIYSFDEITYTIKQQFNKLLDPPILQNMLHIIRLTIKFDTPSHYGIKAFLDYLFDHHINSLNSRIISLRIINEILMTLPSHGYSETAKYIEYQLFNESVQFNDVKLLNQYERCAHTLIVNYKSDVLTHIWKKILEQEVFHAAESFSELINVTEFYKTSSFWEEILKQLKSEDQKNRKVALSLIYNVITHILLAPQTIEVDKLFYWYEGVQSFESSWLNYITIMKNLEENQSHLIIPSLSALKTIQLGDGTPWIRLCYLRLLQQTNTVVLCWTIKYFMENFTERIMKNNLLGDFLKATNYTSLNVEDFFAFRQLNFDSMTKTIFIEAFNSIPWKSVPMYCWLDAMQAYSWTAVEPKLIISLAARVRQLQNLTIRDQANNIMLTIFESAVNRMTLLEFNHFLDVLYCSTSPQVLQSHFNLLIQKLVTSSQLYISYKIFKLLSHQKFDESVERYLIEILKKFEAHEHNWFSLLVIFTFTTEYRISFCKLKYDIDITNMVNQPVDIILQECIEKLAWDNNSKVIVGEQIMYWYAKSQTFSQNEIGLLIERDASFLHHISPDEIEVDDIMRERCLMELQYSARNTDEYAKLVNLIFKNCYNVDSTISYANKILGSDLHNSELAYTVFKEITKHEFLKGNDAFCELLMQGLLFGEPLRGDLRYEHEFCGRMGHSRGISPYDVRQVCLEYLDVCEMPLRRKIQTSLINLSKAMSSKKERYYENSKHHRIKLRIAIALAKIGIWDAYFTDAIWQENNQTNVTHIYEYIVSKTIPEENIEPLLSNIFNLPPRGQISLCFIMLLRRTGATHLTHYLWPLTMSSNFQIRLCSQMVLVSSTSEERDAVFKKSIKKVLDSSPAARIKYETDLRFHFTSEIEDNYIDAVLYSTAVPEDECPLDKLSYLTENTNLQKVRNSALSKQKMSKDTKRDCPPNENFQRKMNPKNVCDDIEDISKDEVNMIVVASLIDKLPNLGGLARTCEVLGIKDFVVKSIKHTESLEFTGVSMTAEKWLRISEVKAKDLKDFLTNKKEEGYQIIGAEQTMKSENFFDFKFPKKCVLLLGHEKEGIPVNLINSLDYAVEIPQRGMVRSLNVHVTGALFVQEYCKQHASRSSK